MKCSTHHAEAIGICVRCGRALCVECAKPASNRMVCSMECAESLAGSERAIQLILQKSLQSARASAFYCYLCAALSAAAAVGAWFYLPLPFLIAFTGGCSVVFLTSGIWYQIVARKNLSDSK